MDNHKLIFSIFQYQNFAEMATGNASRLYVLEANMKYQQINMSPEDLQLLETRKYGVEEICRWFGTPSVLVNQNDGASALGSNVKEIIDGFHKLNLMPAVINIEQAIRKRVMTSRQRADLTFEFNFDALLRAGLKDRVEIYAKKVQNGLGTRNECRLKENDPPIDGGDDLTVQTNLVPIKMLGQNINNGGGNVAEEPISQ